MADIATLGLQIDNAQAVQAVQQTSAALDQLGTKGEAASAKLSGSMSRTIGTSEGLTAAQAQLQGRIDALTTAVGAADLGNVKYVASLREQIATEIKLAAAVGASKAQFAQMAAATAALTVSTEAATVAQDELAVATGTRTVGGLGRLTYSFGALDARLLGTSSIAGRMAAVFGNLGVGVGATLGILAGIAIVGALWRAFFTDTSEGAKLAAEAVKRLTDEVERAKNSMGSLDLQAAKTNLQTARDALDAAKTKAAGRKPGAGDPTGIFGAAISAADTSADAAAVKTAQAVYDQAVQNVASRQAEMLSTLIKGHALTHQERQNAIALLKKDQAEEASLLGKSDDTSMARRVALVDQIRSLNDALNPKEKAGKKPHFLDKITTVVVTDTVDQYAAEYKAAVEAADKFASGKMSGPESISRRAQSDIKGLANAPSGFNDAVDRAKALRGIMEADNAARSANGLKPNGPSDDYKNAQKSVAEYAKTAIEEIQKLNLSWHAQAVLIDEVIKKEREAGLSVKGGNDWNSMDKYEKTAGSLQMGGQLADLLGGPRGKQWGNILNSAANATTDVASAAAQGGMNPLADAQAAISVASTVKSLFSLGKQSHETKDRINEANEALKNTMSIESDILNHNPLQAMLDQQKQSYDQLYASINNTLPGLKNQTQRNIDLAQATDMYNQKLVLTREAFALQQSDFTLSMQARKDAAMGLTFDAAKLNMQIQQANEMANVVNTYGKDSIEAQTLATVQNSEMLRLVNESLTQLSNAPTGFFAENYASSYVTRQPISTPPSSSGSGSTVTGNTIHISIDGSGDPAATARQVVRAIRQIGNSTVGINGTIADAMELM